MDTKIEDIRRNLKEKSDKKTRDSSQRFFKEKVSCYGVKSAIVRKIIKSYEKQIKGLTKTQVFKISEELFKSGYCEESWIGAGFVYMKKGEFEKIDIDVFEKWIDKYIDNWAKCDTFCNHSGGALIEKYPNLIDRLLLWAKSKNRWLRRASVVSLIIPAKNGKFLNEVFKLSDILLEDGDDMVRKGYGWLLKEASRKHQSEVFDYITQNKQVMPRVSLRYAIEKMPQSLRKKAMEK